MLWNDLVAGCHTTNIFVKNHQETLTLQVSGARQYTKNSYGDLTQFGLKNDGEKWSRKNYFKIPQWPSELLLPSAKKSAQKG